MWRHKWVLIAVALGLYINGTPASAAQSALKVDGPTVTASNTLDASSISVRLTNESNTSIVITSISSPDASAAMLFYDANMCQGGHAMTMLNNIFMPSHGIQQLGYRFQGSMLMKLSHAFVPRERVPLVIHWFGNGVHETRVMAVVVAPPKGLRFDMSSMKM
jgi:copper(I)-binding protein